MTPSGGAWGPAAGISSRGARAFTRGDDAVAAFLIRVLARGAWVVVFLGAVTFFRLVTFFSALPLFARFLARPFSVFRPRFLALIVSSARA